MLDSTNEDTARRITGLILKAGPLVDESVAVAKQECPNAAEYTEYRQAAGTVLAAMLFEILNPVYRAHPALKPPELEH